MPGISASSRAKSRVADSSGENSSSFASSGSAPRGRPACSHSRSRRICAAREEALGGRHRRARRAAPGGAPPCRAPRASGACAAPGSPGAPSGRRRRPPGRRARGAAAPPGSAGARRSAARRSRPAAPRGRPSAGRLARSRSHSSSWRMPSISSARVGVRMRGAMFTRFGRKLKVPVAPAEQAEQRLLALDRADRGLDQVAVAHPDRAALLALAGLAPRELDRAAAAVHVEELEQIGERDLREATLELAVGLGVAPGRRPCARAAASSASTRTADLVGVRVEGASTSSNQLAPRSRSGTRPRKTKRTPWVRGLARRISTSFCGVDQLEVGAARSRRRARPRAAASSAAAPCGAKARREAAHGAGLADALGALRVPVRDQDRAAHASPSAAATRRPGCRDRAPSWKVRCSTSTRSQLWKSVTRPLVAGGLARPARRASPRRSRSGTAPACRRGAARPR